MPRLLGKPNALQRFSRYLSLNIHYAPVIVVTIYTMLFIVLSWWNQPFFTDVNSFDGVHSAILSVGAIFAGFLFTALGILISILDRRALKVFMNSDIKRLKSWMLRGTSISILSAFLGLFAMINGSIFWQRPAVFLELLMVVRAMTLFILASINLTTIFDEIWDEEHLPKVVTSINESEITFSNTTNDKSSH